MMDDLDEEERELARLMSVLTRHLRWIAWQLDRHDEMIALGMADPDVDLVRARTLLAIAADQLLGQVRRLAEAGQ